MCSHVSSEDDSYVELQRGLVLLVDLLLSLRADFPFGLLNKTQKKQVQQYSSVFQSQPLTAVSSVSDMNFSWFLTRPPDEYHINHQSLIPPIYLQQFYL